MAEDERFEEKEDRLQEPAFEVTELDDEDLEDASAGLNANENCNTC